MRQSNIIAVIPERVRQTDIVSYQRLLINVRSIGGNIFMGGGILTKMKGRFVSFCFEQDTRIQEVELTEIGGFVV